MEGSVKRDTSSYLINGKRKIFNKIVYHKSTWRAICGLGFDKSEADTVCRIITKNKNSQATSFSAQVPCPLNTKFWAKDLACTGTEQTLEDCLASAWGAVTGCT